MLTEDKGRTGGLLWEEAENKAHGILTHCEKGDFIYPFLHFFTVSSSLPPSFSPSLICIYILIN
jgi:hypothetical protein